MSKPRPLLLIFSGGLDTSACVELLRRKYGFDPIHTLTLDVGQPAEDLRRAERTAAALKTIHRTVGAQQDFVRRFIRPAIWANADYGGYPLSTALARPLIGEVAAKEARRLKTKHVAHGCTGKGNDQFRIELALRVHHPGVKIIAPVRELDLTRKEEVALLKPYGLKFPKKAYSVDENLWGRSIEGEDLESATSPAREAIFAWTKPTRRAPCKVTIRFSQGFPVALNGRALAPPKLIARLNKLAGSYGIGRLDTVEDRVLGYKSREVYECPAATVLIGAHRYLEQLVLTKEELDAKRSLELLWANLAYQGQYHHPLREAVEAFFAAGQRRVTGEVALQLGLHTFWPLSRSSPYAIHDPRRLSFDTKAFAQQKMGPVVEMFGAAGRLAYHADTKAKKFS